MELNKSDLIDPIELSQRLIRCPSVTPIEGGALDELQTVLEGIGFKCLQKVFPNDMNGWVSSLMQALESSRRTNAEQLMCIVCDEKTKTHSPDSPIAPIRDLGVEQVGTCRLLKYDSISAPKLWFQQGLPQGFPACTCHDGWRIAFMRATSWTVPRKVFK